MDHPKNQRKIRQKFLFLPKTAKNNEKRSKILSRILNQNFFPEKNPVQIDEILSQKINEK